MPKYRARVALSYPTDPAIIARLLDGENLRIQERGLKEVAPGEIVDDVPECSVAGLLAKGYLEVVEELPPRRLRPGPEREREEVTDDDEAR